jgi:hypothetical protein
MLVINDGYGNVGVNIRDFHDGHAGLLDANFNDDTIRWRFWLYREQDAKDLAATLRAADPKIMSDAKNHYVVGGAGMVKLPILLSAVIAPRYGVQETQLDGGTAAKGGIDFRALPLTTQPGALPLAPAIDMQLLRQIAQGSSIADLDRAWKSIQSQAQQEPALPCQKIKEYVAVCCQRSAGKDRLNEVSTYLAQVLRLEEDSAVSTTPELKELLVLVETVSAGVS